MRTLLNQLVFTGKVTTTLPRANELRKEADRLVTRIKQGSTRNSLTTHETHLKLTLDLARTYANHRGGYTSVTRRKRRSGDGAQLARVEFVRFERPSQSVSSIVTT
ncbi:Ribosomal protein L17 [Ostreococcus tauri]|uniref:Ribosomal protein L17 n=1 Tax=Ostreococcus tauri TaxID=70448 RepID=A0A090MDG2_OSTTA|nr:Ribosomal protein L17 [Ostreococcus tauri]CEG00956.1 Ribosomal protein L17 [Ostreococcus tauri]|eukprot:XP_003074873.2 Ribosomal protein L17 [Ostreococcus tauri]